MAAQDSADDVRADGPQRTCVVTRRQLPPERLIRFVADPEGRIVPDLGSRLPGRGVWVSLAREAVAAAVKQRAFNRGLKREVTADPGLPDLVERLLAERAVSSLALANKAGLVLTGFTKIEASITSGPIAVLLHGSVAGDDGVEKLDRVYRAVCRDAGETARIIRLLTVEQMSLALGRANVVHAALKTGGAALHFLVQAERLEKYRTGKLDIE